MRHQSQEFINKFIEKQVKLGDVLEVGAFYVNGGISLSLKPVSSSYIGTDMRTGGGVDVVVNAHDLVERFGKEKFDTVISFDSIEHDDEFWKSISQMKEILKPGGYLILGAPGRACPLHDHPDDYWRFMPSAFKKFFEDMEDVNIETEYQPEKYMGQDIEAEIYGWGRKK